MNYINSFSFSFVYENDKVPWMEEMNGMLYIFSYYDKKSNNSDSKCCPNSKQQITSGYNNYNLRSILCLEYLIYVFKK